MIDPKNSNLQDRRHIKLKGLGPSLGPCRSCYCFALCSQESFPPECLYFLNSYCFFYLLKFLPFIPNYFCPKHSGFYFLKPKTTSLCKLYSTCYQHLKQLPTLSILKCSLVSAWVMPRSLWAFFLPNQMFLLLVSFACCFSWSPRDRS